MTRVADGGSFSFVWDVPDGWQQDRGAWGGLIVAAMVRAVVQCEPDREVRAVNVQIPAPLLAGPHRIEITPAKRGSALSVWNVTIDDAARGSVVTGTARVPELHTERWGVATMPTAPPADVVPALDVRPPIGPVFAQHVEFRLVEGLPFTSGTARALGYVQLKDPCVRDAAYFLGLVDAWWPASLTALDAPHPAATVSFEAHLLVDPREVPDGPVLFSSEVLAARQGYTTERRSLWSPDGRLIVENLQSIVVIR